MIYARSQTYWVKKAIIAEYLCQNEPKCFVLVTHMLHHYKPHLGGKINKIRVKNTHQIVIFWPVSLRASSQSARRDISKFDHPQKKKL